MNPVIFTERDRKVMRIIRAVGVGMVLFGIICLLATVLFHDLLSFWFVPVGMLSICCGGYYGVQMHLDLTD